MPNVFMSYASGDKPLIKRMTELLLCTGVIEPWFDGYLRAGVDWKVQLEAAISRCDIFLYALTEASIHSEWCVWELEQAIEQGKTIIPVMLRDNVIMPPTLDPVFTRLQWVDCREGLTTESVAKLVAGILHPRDGVLNADCRPQPKDPVGPPPQALPGQRATAEIPAAMEAHYDALWNEQRDALAAALAQRILEMQSEPIQMRFDKFIVHRERVDHRSEWTYVGQVDPSPYEEFVPYDPFDTEEPQRISEADLKRWLEQFRQAAHDKAAAPMVHSMEQKLIQRGWNSETMTKRWSGRTLRSVEAMSYELVDTQKDVFSICLGEVDVWRRR